MVSDSLLKFAAENYKFDKGTLKFISDSTNQIYVFEKDGQGYILRFAERSLAQIHQTKAEMEWLHYLAKNNINVSLPLRTDDGELVLSTEDNGKNFIISSFEKADGTFWDKNNPSKWNNKIFYNWGKVMGDVHRLTKDYIPANDIDVRGSFTGREALDDSIKSCPSVNEIAEKLIAEMMDLPKDKDSYGLIHYDIHPWNFNIDGEKINLFDFDDSLYGWFVLDIGIALYHGLWWGRKDDARQNFTNSIIRNFIKGYLSSNDISDFWLSKIPMFMKFRQICKFSWFFNPKHIDDHQKERIYNIENDILFTGCDINKSLFISK